MQNIELHCQCMNSDGMIITGARWFYNGTIVPFGTTESTSGAIYQNNSIARNILFINQPFIRASHAGTYTCSPNDVLSSGPQITLNATSSKLLYVYVYVNNYYTVCMYVCLYTY